uniref:Uncharacterized protein n=1 Tax=Gibberella zeae TaxID=5518 RepID=A0A4E9D606_GIBZA
MQSLKGRRDRASAIPMSKRPAKLARDGPRQMGSTEDAELEFGEGCNWKWKNGTKLRLTGRLSVSGKKELREPMGAGNDPIREWSPVQGLTSVASASALQPSSPSTEPNARSVMSVSISIFVWPPPFRAEKLSRAGRSTGSSVKSSRVAWHHFLSVHLNIAVAR